MKELSIEQKAQRYDEALKWMENVYPTLSHEQQMEAEAFFPMFKESKDEKIRKELLNAFQESEDSLYMVLTPNRRESFIAWLEKQGEQSQYWKPSEEQLEALDYAYNSCPDTERGNYYEGVLETIIDDLHKLSEKQGEQKHNPYSGTSFEYNGHTWGMCARDNGVEILFDGELKAFLSSEKSFIYPIRSKPELAPKFTPETINGEKIDNQNCVKPTDKVEPKFHEDDWVFIEEVKGYKNGPFQIKTVDSFGYSFNEYHTIPFMYEDLLSNWTIQDAKDGDVLASEDKDKVFLYNGKLDLRGRVCAYCGIYKTYDGLRFTKCAIGNYFTYKEPYPATKEQRDTLEKAMTDAGYRWNPNEKKLEKIEQKQIVDHPDSLPKDNWELVHEFVETFGKIPEDEDELNVLVEYILKRQKPTEWGEEDEEKFRDVIRLIEQGAPVQSMRDHYTNWLRILKDRIQPQSKPEWSEEDLALLDSAIAFVEHSAFTTIGKGKNCVIAWLKSIRNKTLPQSQPKQEWSEEEQQIIEDAACAILSCVNTAESKQEEEELKKLADKLQDLRPQKQWKPSDKQMKTLNKVIFCTYNANNIEDKKHIESLYNNLKKLTE